MEGAGETAREKGSGGGCANDILRATRTCFLARAKSLSLRARDTRRWGWRLFSSSTSLREYCARRKGEGGLAIGIGAGGDDGRDGRWLGLALLVDGQVLVKGDNVCDFRRGYTTYM